MSEAPIVVSTDLKARSDRAIDRALLIGAQVSHPVKVIHIVGKKDDSEEGRALAVSHVRSVLPDPDADVDILITSGSPPETIARTADEAGAALLVAGVASFNELRDYFLGTAVDYIVRHARTPVLVVKQRPHHPYRSILAPTDFSEPSRQAILQAARLFPDAAIHVVHAYHVPYESIQKAEHVRQEVDAENRGELDAFLSDPQFAALGKGRVTGSIAYGTIDSAVAEKIDETGFDLLVLGTHGQGGFRHATIGSKAAHLLNWANLDTLMVRPSD